MDKDFDIYGVAEILLRHHCNNNRRESIEDSIRSVIYTLDNMFQLSRIMTVVRDDYNVAVHSKAQAQMAMNSHIRTMTLKESVYTHLREFTYKAQRNTAHIYDDWGGTQSTYKPNKKVSININVFDIDCGFVADVQGEQLEFDTVTGMEKYLEANYPSCRINWIGVNDAPNLKRLKWADDDD